MNTVRALLVASALLIAACGTASISGSQVKSVSTSGNVRVDAGVNAGTDVGAGAEYSDMGRVNPTVRKGPGQPVPVQRPQQPAPQMMEPSGSGHDRCRDGIGTNPGFSPGAGSAGVKHPPLPMCAVE
jgi:hypothetical protein